MCIANSGAENYNAMRTFDVTSPNKVLTKFSLHSLPDEFIACHTSGGIDYKTISEVSNLFRASKRKVISQVLTRPGMV